MSEKVWTNECEGCKRLRKKGLDRIAEVERGILKENIKLQSQLAESQAEAHNLKFEVDEIIARSRDREKQLREALEKCKRFYEKMYYDNSPLDAAAKYGPDYEPLTQEEFIESCKDLIETTQKALDAAKAEEQPTQKITTDMIMTINKAITFWRVGRDYGMLDAKEIEMLEELESVFAPVLKGNNDELP